MKDIKKQDITQCQEMYVGKLTHKAKAKAQKRLRNSLIIVACVLVITLATMGIVSSMEARHEAHQRIMEAIQAHKA